MSNINWRNTSARVAMYLALSQNFGKLDWIELEPRLTIVQLTQLCKALQACGIPNVDESKHGALGMQHRWCVTRQELSKADANFASQLGLLFLNRVAAMIGGYITMGDAIILFQFNGIEASLVLDLMNALRAGFLTEDEALGILVSRTKL